MGYYGIILPIDELIFFKMVEATNQVYIVYVYICMCMYVYVRTTDGILYVRLCKGEVRCLLPTSY